VVPLPAAAGENKNKKEIRVLSTRCRRAVVSGPFLSHERGKTYNALAAIWEVDSLMDRNGNYIKQVVNTERREWSGRKKNEGSLRAWVVQFGQGPG